MEAIGYFRAFSGIRQGVYSTIEEQEEGYRCLCQEQGYHPEATFSDTDSVGRVAAKNYRRMLAYIRKHHDSPTVVIKDLRHLHPDPQQTVRCILELEGLGAKVAATDETLDEPLSAALNAWAAQRRGANSGERVRDAMRMRAIHGRGLGRPPFGYCIGEKGKLEIVPEEAETVNLIYQLYINDKMGVRLIARHLNEQGITTKRGGRWSIVGIRDILRNRAYIGTYTRFGVKVPASHKSIIPSYVFNRVQERLSAGPARRTNAPKTPFLLAGLAYCGYCGNKMIGVNRRQSWTRNKDGGTSEGEYRYYQCQTRANQGTCQYHTRRADNLETTVMTTLQRTNSPEARERLMERPWLDAEGRAAERPQLEKKLKALDLKFRNYLVQAAQEKITLEELRAAGRELVGERGFVAQRLALLDAEERGEITAEQRRAHIFEALDDLLQRWESLDFLTRKSLLQYVIDRIMVYDDRVDTQLRL